MTRRRAARSAAELPATILAAETHFKGLLKFGDALRVNGKLDGEIRSTGRLYIGQGAVVRADIKVGSAVIDGTVRGDIVASDSIEMLASARVFGDVRTARLKVGDGVVFEGELAMIASPQELDVLSAPADQVKSAVAIKANT